MVKNDYLHLTHPWGPVYDDNSSILILGSFPSPKSRENGFYYGHPQNVFWKTLSAVLGVDEPGTDPGDRRKFCLKNRIALWDVIAECDIKGADDVSIKNAVPNDIKTLLEKTGITKVFTTGKTATRFYERYCYDQTGIHAVYLPSTSPANRALQGKPEFMEAWRMITSEA